MNLLFIWTKPLDPKTGGVERVTVILINGLSSRGHSCYYLECQNNYTQFIYNGRKIKNIKELLVEKQIDFIINQDGYSSRFSELHSSLKLQVPYFVVFHNDPLMFKHLFSFKRVCKELTIKSHKFSERIKWFLRLALFPIWNKHALKGIKRIFYTNYLQSTKFVLLSPKFLKHFVKASGLKNTSKLIYIPNPLSFMDICDENIILSKKKQVLIVTRLFEPEKRISLCLKVWKRIEQLGFQDWSLEIVGHGPDENYYKLQSKRLGLKRVTFHGMQDSYPYYCQASLFMMTSKFEGWGLTLTESLQTGVVPLVMDSYPSLNDIIIHGYNGIIIKNNDIASFVAELRTLMEDGLKRNIMAKNALNSAHKFSVDHTMDNWESFLKIEFEKNKTQG